MSLTVSNASQIKVFSTPDLLDDILSFSGRLSDASICKAFRDGARRALEWEWRNFPIERFSFVHRVIQAPHERPTNIAELYLLFQRFSRLTAKFRPTNRISVHTITFCPSRICAAWERVFQGENDANLMEIMPSIRYALPQPLSDLPANADEARNFLHQHRAALDAIDLLDFREAIITTTPEEFESLHFPNLTMVILSDDCNRMLEPNAKRDWESIFNDLKEASSEEYEEITDDMLVNLDQTAVDNGAVKSSQS